MKIFDALCNIDDECYFVDVGAGICSEIIGYRAYH